MIGGGGRFQGSCDMTGVLGVLVFFFFFGGLTLCFEQLECRASISGKSGGQSMRTQILQKKDGCVMVKTIIQQRSRTR